MTYTPPPQWPAPPAQPPKKRHWLRNSSIIAGLLLLAGIFAAVAAGSGSDGTSTPRARAVPATSAAPSANAAAAPAASADPKGKALLVAANYELGNSGMGPYTVVAEVDLTNTGNIGTVDRVTAKWPQLGLPPLRMTKTVHVAAGHSKAVRFSMPVSQGQISALQDYQTSSPGDGYAYKATIISTYGAVKS